MWRGRIAEGGKDENEVDKEITRDGILYIVHARPKL